MKFSLYIFVSLLSLYFSQNIITTWNYDKVAMYDLQKIITFLNVLIVAKVQIEALENIKQTQNYFHII